MDLYLALDAVAAALMLTVVALLLRRQRGFRHPHLELLALGFLLIGLSFLSVSRSEFEPGQTVWDGLRIVGQLGGVLVLLFGYVSVRLQGYARPAAVAGYVAFAVSAFLNIALLALPRVAGSPWDATFLAAHSLMALAYTGCAVLAARSLLAAPSLQNGLAPAAFLAFAVGKYTWMLRDVTGTQAIVPFAYLFRFLGLALLLLSVGIPLPSRKAPFPEA